MRLRSGTGPTSAVSAPHLPTLIDALGKFVASRGLEAYLVGGVLRDSLLGRETGDVDVAVAADAQGVGRELASFLGGRSVPLDKTREITRVVVTGDDGSSFVDLGSISQGISQDLQRRDFTIDAMALPLSETASQHWWSDIIDPHDGLSDLREGLIRAVAPSVFEADPARLVRAPRLSVQLRFEITEDTTRLIRRHSHLVTGVAPERIRDEFMKLLAEPCVAASLRLLDDLGLLCQVIPELADAKDVTQPKEHHWDVYNHLIETSGQVENVVSEQPGAGGFVGDSTPHFERMRDHFEEEVSDGHTRLTLLKLTGLLHDIAKPATRTVESSGRIRFLGHHTEGAEVAERILQRLRVSGRGVELVRLMVQYHLRPGQMAQEGELPTGRAIYRYFRDLGDAAIDTLYLNMADYLAARGPDLRRHEWSQHCRVIGHIMREGLERKAPDTLPNLVNGHDIMKTFSLSPGPKVGTLLRHIQEAQAGGEINTKEEALKMVQANLDMGQERA